jgi:hypothetical protein
VVSAKEKLAWSENTTRLTPASASGPPSLRSIRAKHREVLDISPGPPRNGTDVTQNGKPRQCVSALIFFEAGRSALSRALRQLVFELRKNTLALAKSCGRLAPFRSPLTQFQGFRALR